MIDIKELTLEKLIPEGVCLYHNIDDLENAPLDPLIRPVCEKICSSGWCFTAESCQGHPDADVPDVWAGNTAPMLRLFCKPERMGDMLKCLMEASFFEYDMEEGFENKQEGTFMTKATVSWKVFPYSLNENWFSALIYFEGSTVWDRKKIIEQLMIFGEKLCEVSDGNS